MKAKRSKVRKKAHVEEAWAIIDVTSPQFIASNMSGNISELGQWTATFISRKDAINFKNRFSYAKHLRVVRVQIKELRGR